MKKLIALLSVVMALAIGVSVIAIAEQTNVEATATEAAEVVVEATEEPAPAVTAEPAATEAPVVTVAPTAEPTAVPVPTATPHIHEWNANGRECTGCGEAHPCWNDEEKTFNHDFAESDACAVCAAALYCGIEGHEMNEEHMIGACGVAGHFVCDEKEHDRVYGNGFDYEGHTACLEEVEHFCEACGSTYTCEFTNSHVPCIKCENMWCYKAEGDHTEAACGHRFCEMGGKTSKHSKCEGCGQFKCNGVNHENCVPVVPPTTDEPEVPPTTEIPEA